MERAERLLGDAGQGELDLGVEPARRTARLVTRRDVDAGLFAEPGRPERGGRTGRARVSAPRVVGTGSRVLFDALDAVYTDLGFTAVSDANFRDLVIARIVEPTSTWDTGRVLGELGRAAASERTMRPHPGPMRRARLPRPDRGRLFHPGAGPRGCVAVPLRRDHPVLRGREGRRPAQGPLLFSKERRVDPQVLVGLLVDRHGFPLEIGCFAGNKAETTTLVPIINAFRGRHRLTDMVVIADAGMLSTSNLTELDEAGLRFVVGSRTVKAPVDLASHFRWHGTAFTDGQIIDTITPKHRRVVENDPNLKAEPVWNPEHHGGSWRAVWAYSTRRAVHDNKTITLQENRARAVVAGEKTARAPRFVTTANGTRRLDEASLARARLLVGLKGYVTNIDTTTMPAEEVIANYHDLWHVEQSFRMSKTDLRARPMFHHTRDAIEAHLTIVFAALAVSRETQNRTGLAIRNLLRQLRPLRSATITANGVKQTIPPAIPTDKQAILDAMQRPTLRH